MGCGMTRAMRALVVGEYSQAFGYNPLGVIVFPLLFGMAIVDGVLWVLQRPLWFWPRLDQRCGIAGLVVVVVYVVARNLPYWPFSLLAP